MDVFGPSLGASTRLLRRLAGRLLGRPMDVGDSEPSVSPQHGGVRAASQASGGGDSARREEERRRSTLAAMLGLPPGTQVDVVADDSAGQLTFVVRDRATGRNLRTVPEAEARELIERFQLRFGLLVDRAY